MDYMHTHPHATLRYYKSDMKLHIDSDAAYLVMPQAKSRVAGYFQLTNEPDTPEHFRNGHILVECRTLRHVVTSSAEAEMGGVFHNTQIAIPLQRLLIGLGHPQPPTPIKTDNTTAQTFVNNTILPKRSKTWDMRYHWLRDRKNANEFRYYWMKGSDNDADPFTKHFTAKANRANRPKYVQDHHCINVIFSPCAPSA